MRSDTNQCIFHGRPSGYLERELDERVRSLHSMYATKIASYAVVGILSTVLGYRAVTGRLPSLSVVNGVENYGKLLGSSGALVGGLTGGFIIAAAENFLPNYREEYRSLERSWRNADPRVASLSELVTELDVALAGIDDYMGDT